MKEKRYNGDGSITLRKDGRWMVRITKGFRADGKRNVVTRYAHSEQEAKKILKTLRVQLETRKIGAPGVTLNEYMEQFLEVYKKETVKAVSYDTYRVVFENHIRRELGYKKLADITKNDIQRLINEKSQVRSYSTISKMKVLLNMCFKHALEDDVVYKNPVAGVRIPGKKEMGVKARQIDVLSQKEIDVLKEAALGPITDDMTTRFAPAFLLMLNTGIRMGEMLALTWQDIDMEEQVLHVNKTMTIIQNRERNEGAPKVLVTTSEPKSISSRRTVPLNSMAIRALIRMREYRGGELRETDYLLCNKNRGMVTQEFLYRAFDHILEKGMGDEYVHHGLHIFRHTFASRFCENETNIKVIQEVMGHADVSTTMNIYAEANPDVTKSVIEKLSKNMDIF